MGDSPVSSDKPGGGRNVIVRIAWFLFLGLGLSQFLVALAWLLSLTGVGLPLAAKLLDVLPELTTLQRPERADASADQPAGESKVPHWGWRVVYFLCIGFWFSLIWIEIGWSLCLADVGLPAAAWMFGRLSKVTTLGNQSVKVRWRPASGSDKVRTGPEQMLKWAGLSCVGLFVLVALANGVGLGANGNRPTQGPQSQSPLVSLIDESTRGITPVPTRTPRPIPTATLVPTATPVPKLGDTVSSGNWRYTVVAVDRKKVIDIDTQAKGIWQIVRVKVENVGKETYSFNDWDFAVKDANGITYKTDSAASFSYSYDSKLSYYGDQFPPGVPVRIGLAFDVNPNAQGLMLYLDQGEMLIDLQQ